ncbi:hypothetical protein CFP71_21315 [Amycolatopsis thailandensis]|uniref:Uncharacterized protein n=2 Tax=Amycolatopsis thailandensis TaxID=589330 RepID=A0A229S573_9PSEU|nr:hypothetical protein CFP71_21315 [Amycolatopsis thailandensis]
MARITKENRCGGSYKRATDLRSLSHLGKKFDGRVSGKCSVCRGTVNVQRRDGTATLHLPRAAA